MTVIKAKAALLGKELTYTPDPVVVVENGKISEILPADSPNGKKLAEQKTTLVFKDLLLMPGMIDSHAHLAMDARVPGHLMMMNDPESRQTMRAVRNVADDITAGITGMRCLGDRYFLDVEMRDCGDPSFPWMSVSGIGMKGIHGHGYVGMSFSGAEAFRRQARENLYRKVDWLKIFITPGTPPVGDVLTPWYMTREEVRAVVEEARSQGVKTTAHCIGGTGLRYVCEEGIDTIEHCYWVTDEDIELIMKHDKIVSYTSGIIMDPGREPMCPESQNVKVRATREESIKRMSKLVAAGPKFVIGTDAYHAMIWREVMYMRELGMDAKESLKGITVYPGELYGDSVGVLEKGYKADIIGILGDPITDAKALADPQFVMHNGIRFV